MPSSGYFGFGWKCFMPWTENSSQGEEATMKSKLPQRIKSALTARTLTPDQQQFFGISGGSCKSMPIHSHPRAANALLQPQRPQNRSSSLMREVQYFLMQSALGYLDVGPV